MPKEDQPFCLGAHRLACSCDRIAGRKGSSASFSPAHRLSSQSSLISLVDPHCRPSVVERPRIRPRMTAGQVRPRFGLRRGRGRLSKPNHDKSDIDGPSFNIAGLREWSESLARRPQPSGARQGRRRPPAQACRLLPPVPEAQQVEPLRRRTHRAQACRRR